MELNLESTPLLEEVTRISNQQQYGAGSQMFNIDRKQGVFIGADDYANAPFKVDFSGNITASSFSATGGSISGLTITGGTIQTAAAGSGVNRVRLNGTTNALEFLNNTDLQCSLTTDGTNKMILTASGQIKFALGTDSQTWYMDSTGFYPMTDKQGALGSSSKEWSSVYSQNYRTGSSTGGTATFDFNHGESKRFVFINGLFISKSNI